MIFTNSEILLTICTFFIFGIVILIGTFCSIIVGTILLELLLRIQRIIRRRFIEYDQKEYREHDRGN